MRVDRPLVMADNGVAEQSHFASIVLAVGDMSTSTMERNKENIEQRFRKVEAEMDHLRADNRKLQAEVNRLQMLLPDSDGRKDDGVTAVTGTRPVQALLLPQQSQPQQPMISTADSLNVASSSAVPAPAPVKAPCFQCYRPSVTK